MRSWAFFIFEAETISIAFVILRVLCTLLILLRISFEPAIVRFPQFGCSTSSFPRTREPRVVESHWAPAFAGATVQ